MRLVGVALLCAAPLLVNNGGWLALAIAAAVGSVYLFRGKLIRPAAIALLGFRLVPVLFALAAMLAAIWQGPGAVQSSLPLLLVAGLLTVASAALGHIKVPAALGFGAFAFAGVASGSWAAWQHIAQGARRASGYEPLHAILYGNLSLSVGLICLAGLAWAWQCPQRIRWLLLCGLGVLGGLVASVLSGTRGGWLALPLAGLVFYRIYLNNWPRWWRAVLLVSIALLLVSVYTLPQIGVQGRVNSAIEEGQDYLQGDAHGSIGIRMELYRVSFQLIVEKPLLGYSLADYQSAMQVLRSEGEISRSVARHWHVHNDILHAWVRYGLLGLAATLLLYLWPLWFFSRQLKVATPEQRPVVLAGLLLPVMFFDFGLSYAFFAYPVVLAIYWVWLLVLASMYLSSGDRVPPLSFGTLGGHRCQGSASSIV